MKNMKKLTMLLLTLILTLIFTACTAKPSDSDLDVVNTSGDYIYGKITNITGNEIEMALAEMPDENDEEDPGDILGGDVEIPMGDNAIPAVGGAVIDDVTDNLEFTGETNSFTIPAGIKVYSMGQEINLSNLKKGDIISVSVDPENPDTVLSVEKVK